MLSTAFNLVFLKWTGTVAVRVNHPTEHVGEPMCSSGPKFLSTNFHAFISSFSVMK